MPDQNKPAAEGATPGAVPPDAEPGVIQPGVVQPGVQPAVQPGVIQPGSEGPIAGAPETTTPAEPEYGGPAILSRGGTSSLRFPSETVKIRPFVSASANYDTGITPVTVSAQGQIPNDSSFGGEVQAGLYGYYRWKTAVLGLNYRGDYRDYIKNSYYNGSDQSLSLIFQKQLERHLSATLRESAGLFSQNFYTPAPYNLVDPTFAYVPTNDIFDGRTIYMDTSLDVIYRMSARLSFNFGGDGFLTRRESSSLYGDTGYRARGDFAYRTNRYATTGAAYDFTNYTFTKGFGGSNIHTLQLTQAFRFGRNWELSLRAGGSRVETSGIIQVAVDPVIAAIIGNTEGLQTIHRINWVPSAKVLLTRKFHHATLSLTYDRGVVPGNGLYLTSRQENIFGNLSYSGVRKWTFAVQGGHVSFGSVTQNIGNYGSWTGGAGVTYKIAGPFGFVARYDYRRYDIAETVFNRNTSRASIGVSYSAKDIPLALW